MKLIVLNPTVNWLINHDKTPIEFLCLYIALFNISLYLLDLGVIPYARFEFEERPRKFVTVTKDIKLYGA